jgi:hypothetical protein
MNAIATYADALETLTQPRMVRHVSQKVMPDRCDSSPMLIVAINLSATAVLYYYVLAQS